MSTTTIKNFRAYEAIAHEMAEDAAHERRLTPEQRAEARAIYDAGMAKLAELTRKSKSTARTAQVRPSILAMARDAVMQRIDALLNQPNVVLAYRDFRSLSDEDLRAMLEDVERHLEGTAGPN